MPTMDENFPGAQQPPDGHPPVPQAADQQTEPVMMPMAMPEPRPVPTGQWLVLLALRPYVLLPIGAALFIADRLTGYPIFMGLLFAAAAGGGVYGFLRWRNGE